MPIIILILLCHWYPAYVPWFLGCMAVYFVLGMCGCCTPSRND
jgi:hypothetical protein